MVKWHKRAKKVKPTSPKVVKVLKVEKCQTKIKTKQNKRLNSSKGSRA